MYLELYPNVFVPSHSHKDLTEMRDLKSSSDLQILQKFPVRKASFNNFILRCLEDILHIKDKLQRSRSVDHNACVIILTQSLFLFIFLCLDKQENLNTVQLFNSNFLK